MSHNSQVSSCKFFNFRYVDTQHFYLRLASWSFGQASNDEKLIIIQKNVPYDLLVFSGNSTIRDVIVELTAKWAMQSLAVGYNLLSWLLILLLPTTTGSRPVTRHLHSRPGSPVELLNGIVVRQCGTSQERQFSK